MNKIAITSHSLVIRKIIFPLFIISSFILHPSSFAHTRLYACVIGNDAAGSSMGGSSLGAGLWQSDDTAKTWKQLGWKHVKCYSVDVVNKSNGKIIYEACGNGVLMSKDGGINWKMLTDWRITEVLDIAIDQKSPNNIYIATAEAIWKSNDGGDNWYEADSDIPYPIFVSRIKIDQKDHLKIYAATETGIYISNDGGLEWKKEKQSPMEARDVVVTKNEITEWVYSGDTSYLNEKDKFSDLWCMLSTSDILYTAGPKGVFSISENDQVFLPSSPLNVHSLEIIGNNLFMGSLSGGVWKYDISDTSTAPILAGLENAQIWRIKAVEIK